MNHLAIKSFRIKNFKAIKDSGLIELKPLTVLIGNNGAGKSSFIEGLEIYHAVMKKGLTTIINRWQNFKQIDNQINYQSEAIEQTIDNRNSIALELGQDIDKLMTFRSNIDITLETENKPIIHNEMLFFDNELIVERQIGNKFYFPEAESFKFSAPAGNEFSILSKHNSALWAALSRYINSIRSHNTSAMLIKWLENINKNKHFWDSFDWQFINLESNNIESTETSKRKISDNKLNQNGSNIARYLLNIQRSQTDIYQQILTILQSIYPHIKDLQTKVSPQMGTNVYLEITEINGKIPQWQLSTGILKMIKLLAVLCHPNPPPLIIIEGIEVGLDPHAIKTMIKQIIKLTSASKTQIIMTTHSPYLINLLALENIILVKRNQAGNSTFNNVTSKEEIQSVL
ncbi:MAG: AAA family ATPase [Thiomargarita sp.]|nr:AAA family ATPase [Thiomargarita sp.]